MPSKVTKLSAGRPAAKPSRKPAVLTVGPLSKADCAQEWPIGPIVKASLSLKVSAALTLTHEEPSVLGFAAAIAGVRIVEVRGFSLPPEGAKLYTSRSRWSRSENEFRWLNLPKGVYWPVTTFHMALASSVQSRTQYSEQHLQHVMETTWPIALALVPAEFRVMERLEPGFFDERGNIMPPSEIARRARFSRMLGGAGSIQEFFEQSAEKLEQGPVEDEGVTLYSDVANDEPDAPVTFSGESELQMRRIIDKLGLERMPFTVAEYAGVLEYLDWFEDWKANDAIMNPEANPEVAESRRARHVAFALEYRPAWATPLGLYLAGKTAKLKAHHAKHRFVEYLGKWWVWFDKREDDIREGNPIDHEGRPFPFGYDGPKGGQW